MKSQTNSNNTLNRLIRAGRGLLLLTVLNCARTGNDDKPPVINPSPPPPSQYDIDLLNASALMRTKQAECNDPAKTDPKKKAVCLKDVYAEYSRNFDIATATHRGGMLASQPVRKARVKKKSPGPVKSRTQSVMLTNMTQKS